jgi:hypothetical protein
MAIDNDYLVARIVAIENRINDLQKVIESIPKLRQLGALKAVFEQDIKEINSAMLLLTSRVSTLENK